MTWALRCAVVLVVVLAGFVGATVQPGPAEAYVDPPWYTETNWSIVDDWLRTENPPSSLDSLNEKQGAKSAWERAKRITGKRPPLKLLGTVSILATAGYVGWEIPHATGLSGWLYGKFSGTLGPAPVGLPVTDVKWQHREASAYGGVVPADSWTMSTVHSPGSVTTADYCNPSVDGGACSRSQTAWDYASLQSIGVWAPVAPAFCGVGTTTCHVRYLSNAAMEGLFTTIENRAYNASTDLSRKTHTAPTQPAPAPTPFGSPAADEAADEMSDDPDLDEDLTGYFLPGSGGGTGSEFIQLPQPRLNETATAYRTRLRNLGFLGTLTLFEEDPAHTEFGPMVVTAVEVQTQTTLTDFPMTLPWPEPPPLLDVPGTDTEITIFHNPADAPAPGPGAPGSPQDPPPGPAPPPGGGGIGPGDCACPPPDFGPITGIDYGDTFPFGVVAWVAGILGGMTETADAPVFDFDFTAVAAGDFGPLNAGHYVVDLDVLDTYMATIRTIISWCLWVGAIWWTGTRLLGYNLTGDPGAAVDDVL